MSVGNIKKASVLFLQKRSDSGMKKIIEILRKYLPVCILLVVVIFCIRYKKDLSVEKILHYTPEDPFKAAVLLLALYAVKSISFVFPIAVLQLAVGHLFSTTTALLVNFLGRAITLALPYWMGSFSGASMVKILTEKYPKLKTVVDYQNGNPLYISFFMRTLNFLPGDAVSLFLGAVKIPFGLYMAGGMLGTLPGVILSTVFGANIKNPGSPAFWLSAVLLVLISVSSMLIHRYRSAKKSENAEK